jgi:hypothetical protein
MKYKITAVFTIFVFVMNFSASTFADAKTRKGANDLVALLPASDGVFVVDSKRFFGEALPKLLASNQAMLTKVNAKIDEIKTRAGVDVRDFDSMVVGITARQLGEKLYDVDPVIIGRGRTTSAAIVGSAKLAANGKFREERVGERVMYIFDEKVNVLVPSTGTVHTKEVAVSALDEKTIAFGEVGRVRQTLEGKTRVGADLVTLLEKSLTSVGAFAIKPPTGLKSFLPIENDELGKNIDSIQYIYGHAAVGADNATVHVTARTLENTQAKGLYDTLQVLQILGKSLLGGSKAADKQVYVRLIDSAKFAVKGNEVTFDLAVPQSDIDILVGSIK